ncbi:MAG: zinc ribbon domain-containing protein, partial [Dehalococcoidales bacterium]
MKCPRCQQDNLPEADFCIVCGESLQAEPLCHHCGHTNPRGSIFCDECGDLLSGITPDDSGVEAGDSAEGKPSSINSPLESIASLNKNDAQPDLLSELKEGVEKWTAATGQARRAMEEIARLTRYSPADSPEPSSNHDREPIKGRGKGKTRVFVIDRDLLFYQGLHLYISQTDDIEAIGYSAHLIEGTIPMADGLPPDIVLIEADLPSFQGLDSAWQLIKLFPNTLVIMFSPYRSDDQIFAALKTGVTGYLGKAITGEEFI